MLIILQKLNFRVQIRALQAVLEIGNSSIFEQFLADVGCQFLIFQVYIHWLYSYPGPKHLILFSSNIFHLTPKLNIWGIIKNSSRGVKQGQENFVGLLLGRRKMYEARLRDLSIQRTLQKFLDNYLSQVVIYICTFKKQIYFNISLKVVVYIVERKNVFQITNFKLIIIVGCQ